MGIASDHCLRRQVRLAMCANLWMILLKSCWLVDLRKVTLEWLNSSVASLKFLERSRQTDYNALRSEIPDVKAESLGYVCKRLRAAVARLIPGSCQGGLNCCSGSCSNLVPG